MNTTGQDFAKMVRTYFRIGPRTRTYRDHRNMKREILTAILENSVYPGIFNEEQTELFRAAYPAFLSYQKHIDGNRVDGMVAYEIEKMSPYQFASFIGDMIDSGISNTCEGEIYFQNMRRGIYAKAA